MEMDNMAGLGHLFVIYFLSNFATIIVIPTITDVTMETVCPGRDECSLAIYLSGFQQAVAGLGSVFTIPLIGNLSDVYGRKALLTLPLTVSIIPSVILAYKRTTNFFYAYYAFKTLTAMVEGSTQCLALGYVADNISEGKRASSFGVLAGVGSAAFVGGTLAARFLPTAKTFLVAAIVSMVAAVYLQLFLKDAIRQAEALKQPILKNEKENTQFNCESSKKIQAFKKIPSPTNIICLLKSSATLKLAAAVAFSNSLAEGALQTSLLYFLRVRFHFNKDQFAEIMLIANIGGTIAQLFFVPMLAPLIGEEIMLSLGLFSGVVTMLLDSVAWSFWVPYAAAFLSVFLFLATPSLRSIVSKQVGPSEQGIAQGCISGITSFATILSPLIYSPLTALFLSEEAPFRFPGFSIMCIGLAWMMAFIASTMIKSVPIVLRDQLSSGDDMEA